MHLTLHFIGDAEPERLLRPLEGIRAQSFELNLERLGSFGNPRRGGILWIGTSFHPALQALHRELRRRLSALGVQTDDREFKPHITLARCRRGVPNRVFRSFVQQAVPPLSPLPVDRFVLYSSRPGERSSIYTEEQSYPLGRNEP